ncbi:hypothetical protein E1166_05280 [Micromonospora sp. KC213]|nr:hypothetical protein E1166_05280 [Micromonospora sp. KC213]
MSTHGGVRTWLCQHGAEQIAHPGGNLYAHLCRVSDRLALLGHSSPFSASPAQPHCETQEGGAPHRATTRSGGLIDVPPCREGHPRG